MPPSVSWQDGGCLPTFGNASLGSKLAMLSMIMQRAQKDENTFSKSMPGRMTALAILHCDVGKHNEQLETIVKIQPALLASTSHEQRTGGTTLPYLWY